MKSNEVKKRDGHRSHESKFYFRPYTDNFKDKLPRKPPLSFWIIIILCMVVYAVFERRSHIETDSTSILQLLNATNTSLIERSCDLTGIDPSQRAYVHFPKPNTFDRGECSCNPVRYFIILSMQRSGTIWLISSLNSHTNISIDGETFFGADKRNNIVKIFETLHTVHNMDLTNSWSKTECVGAVGFVWMLNQGVIRYHKEIAEYFKLRGVLPIFLFRRNILRSYVSMVAASTEKIENAVDQYHVESKNEAQLLANYKATINTTSLIDILKRDEELIAKCFEYFDYMPHVTLYYEDLLKNHEKWMDDVQDFLRVPRQKLSSKQVKIHIGPLSSYVRNWEEVVEALMGTRYERYLYLD